MSRLSRILTHRAFYHALLWLLYVSLVLIASESGLQWLSLRNVLIHSIFVAGLLYFNFYYLQTHFLQRKRPLTYLLLLFVASVVVSPLQLITLFFSLQGRLDAQQSLIDNQISHWFFLFSIALIASAMRIIKYWFVQQNLQRDLERRQLQSELSFLRSQINPHFLFNTLNSLYALTLKKSEQAPEVVLRLSEMMRYMLYECNERYVPLSLEIQYIENYLALERVRYGSKAHIEFEHECDSTLYTVAPLLFITFLENSFKHGLSHSIDSGYVAVFLQATKGELELNITNSKAQQKDPQFYSGGIGLVNVRRRLELLYPDAHELQFEEDAESFNVLLRLKLLEKSEK